MLDVATFSPLRYENKRNTEKAFIVLNFSFDAESSITSVQSLCNPTEFFAFDLLFDFFILAIFIFSVFIDVSLDRHAWDIDNGKFCFHHMLPMVRARTKVFRSSFHIENIVLSYNSPTKKNFWRLIDRIYQPYEFRCLSIEQHRIWGRTPQKLHSRLSYVAGLLLIIIINYFALWDRFDQHI